jgi:two-component system CheB/CheR fusion protein
VTTKDAKWFYVKIMPYRTLDDHRWIGDCLQTLLWQKAEEALNYENRYCDCLNQQRMGLYP